MRIINGTVKSTPLQWLPILANIKPLHIQRKEALIKTIKKSEDLKRSLLYLMLLQISKQRLKSRRDHQKVQDLIVLRNGEWNELALLYQMGD